MEAGTGCPGQRPVPARRQYATRRVTACRSARADRVHVRDTCGHGADRHRRAGTADHGALEVEDPDLPGCVVHAARRVRARLLCRHWRSTGAGTGRLSRAEHIGPSPQSGHQRDAWRNVSRSRCRRATDKMRRGLEVGRYSDNPGLRRSRRRVRRSRVHGPGEHHQHRPNIARQGTWVVPLPAISGSPPSATLTQTGNGLTAQRDLKRNDRPAAAAQASACRAPTTASNATAAGFTLNGAARG